MVARRKCAKKTQTFRQNVGPESSDPQSCRSSTRLRTKPAERHMQNCLTQEPGPKLVEERANFRSSSAAAPKCGQFLTWQRKVWIKVFNKIARNTYINLYILLPQFLSPQNHPRHIIGRLWFVQQPRRTS